MCAAVNKSEIGIHIRGILKTDKGPRNLSSFCPTAMENYKKYDPILPGQAGVDHWARRMGLRLWVLYSLHLQYTSLNSEKILNFSI